MLLKILKKILLVFAVAVASIALLIGGGYIYSLFHGYLHISLYDVSKKHKLGGVCNAEIVFHDENGATVGTAYTDDKLGVVYINYPDFGKCAEGVKEEKKWYACRRERSRWSVKLAERIRSISIKTKECELKRLPVNVRVNRSEAYTYFIPLPHVMGTPLSYYSIYLKINLAACSVVN